MVKTKEKGIKIKKNDNVDNISNNADIINADVIEKNNVIVSEKTPDLKNSEKIAKAISKNVPSTPRKIGLILKLIRKKGKKVSVKEALNILESVNKKGAIYIIKTIKSTVSNAKNLGMDVEKLYIYEILANDGIRLKRFMTRAKGSSSSILKRKCHIYVILKEKK